MKGGSVAAIGLLWMGTACQLVLGVSDYRFSDADAGGAISELEPLLGSGAFTDPPEVDATATPPQPRVDAGSDAEAAPPEEEPEPEPSPPQPEPEPPAQPSPPDPANGCSIIEFCYAHLVQDTTDEERCIQRGCSLDDAIAECRAEIAETCGRAPQPPYVMITQSGERVILN
jgi:hypothetical protein